MTYETLLPSKRAGVARIVLNRPEMRNALSRMPVEELGTALAAFEGDAEARAIVLSGAGEKAFCAGADLRGVGDQGTTLQARESFSGLARILERMPTMRTPAIAQVHGHALAGGCGLAVGCDIVIASDDARFGLPEIKIGLLHEALEIGLVSRVVPRDQLEAETSALAEKLASYSPTALAVMKEAVAVTQDMECGKALHYLRDLITLVGMSDDAKEGIAAFFEKRAPEWKGR